MDKPAQEVGERQKIARPISVYSQDLVDGEVVLEHHHPRGQLLWPATGSIRVSTPRRTWLVPPERAIWLPSRVPHGFTAFGPTTIHTLYATRETCAAMPAEVRTVATTELLRALLARALTFPLLYDEEGPEGMVMRLILSEIAALPGLPMSVPMPEDPRLRRFADAVIDRDEASVEAWAGRLALGLRTFVRRFQAETGLTPSAFQRQVRLLRALRLMTGGASVTSAAFEAGYETPSAFIEAFRSAFGDTPGAYVRKSVPGP